MAQISYQEYLNNRQFLNRPVANSTRLAGFTMFKDVEEARKHCVNDKLFIVSLTVEQWPETDMYPQLHDGEKDKAFGYFVAYGENVGDCCVFDEFPWR